MTSRSYAHNRSLYHAIAHVLRSFDFCPTGVATSHFRKLLLRRRRVRTSQPRSLQLRLLSIVHRPRRHSFILCGCCIGSRTGSRLKNHHVGWLQRACTQSDCDDIIIIIVIVISATDSGSRESVETTYCRGGAVWTRRTLYTQHGPAVLGHRGAK